jgi:endonuclease/exonuclease/phosphatase family metal-dependent hydrolase
VRLVVLTWNLFHGNANPPERRAFLEPMVRLASADRPDVLCLQELPVWSLRLLDDWSGMTAVGDVAARPMIGPIPSTAEIGRRITDLNHGLFRSAFTGQAVALLLGSSLRLDDHEMVVLNQRGYRRRQARRLGLDLAARVAWARERRVCQVVRARREDGSTLVVANLHATSYRPDRRLADAELHRAASFVDGFARPDEPVLLCGDFNLSLRNSRLLPELTGPEWGFEGPSPHGIDHILARRISLGPPSHWPEVRRRLDGRLLSDHAPLERHDA